MKLNRFCLLALSSMLCLFAEAQQKLDVDKELHYCHGQILRALDKLKPYDYTMEPRHILPSDTEGDGGWKCRPASAEEWCSGFWPGILWMDYMATGDKQVRKAAQGYTKSLASIVDQRILWMGYMAIGDKQVRKAAQGNTKSLASIVSQPVFDHDLGFLILCAYGKGYEATHNDAYRRMVLRASDSLATLFNAKAGTILSWPRHVADYGGHNTIIDNMMNLDMLLWSAEHGGNPLLRDIAVMHAMTTMRNHFRPDGSSYHVAVYDLADGHFLRGLTHQGYADSSMWARGQAWAVYGYTMMYRYTRDALFLDFACHVTDAYLKRLGETSDDWVPLWDMDDPRGSRQVHEGLAGAMDRRMYAPKDASAACIVASALLELSQYVKGEKGESYRQAAVKMLTDLSENYQSREQNVAFLLHSTGNHPAGSEIDASIIYADYYYLEALLRLKALTD